jgi:predicted phosphodiesterase
MMPEIPRAGRDTPVINFDSTPASMFSPFATLIVTNETDRGLYLLQGSSCKINQNGTTMINPGSETYELNLQKQSHLVVGGLKIDVGLGQSENKEAIDYANWRCDFLIHTGDIIDFVSYLNVSREALADIKYFFVADNHESSKYVGEAPLKTKPTKWTVCPW